PAVRRARGRAAEPPLPPRTPAGGSPPPPSPPPPPTSSGGPPPLQPSRPLPGINGFNPLMFSPFNPNYNPANSNAVTYYYLTRYGYGGYSTPYSPYYSSLSGYGAPSGG